MFGDLFWLRSEISVRVSELLASTVAPAQMMVMMVGVCAAAPPPTELFLPASCAHCATNVPPRHPAAYSTCTLTHLPAPFLPPRTLNNASCF